MEAVAKRQRNVITWPSRKKKGSDKEREEGREMEGGGKRERGRREGKIWLWRKPHSKAASAPAEFPKRHSDSVNFLSILSQISLQRKRRGTGTTGQENAEDAGLGSRRRGRGKSGEGKSPVGNLFGS